MQVDHGTGSRRCRHDRYRGAHRDEQHRRAQGRVRRHTSDRSGAGDERTHTQHLAGVWREVLHARAVTAHAWQHEHRHACGREIAVQPIPRTHVPPGRNQPHQTERCEVTHREPETVDVVERPRTVGRRDPTPVEPVPHPDAHRRAPAPAGRPAAAHEVDHRTSTQPPSPGAGEVEHQAEQLRTARRTPPARVCAHPHLRLLLQAAHAHAPPRAGRFARERPSASRARRARAPSRAVSVVTAAAPASVSR
ncbi:hypothetical protein GALL_359860 [mine drainage metagenome]|uniref:Uncharacterized protein n=1 Tax=mine drainage metagenome TaxID=410659 RepID=A0A1J5QFA8_9ZZZZ